MPSPGFPLSTMDIVDIAKTRMWYFIIPATLIVTATILVALYWPPNYLAAATVAVESQQIPEEFIRSTITANAVERIEYITQRVLTRSRVLDIAKSLAVFPDSDLSDTAKVANFRDRVEIDVVSANVLNRRNAAIISFSIGFHAGDPKMSQSVANELVTMFLNENVKTRSDRAAQTTEFLAEEGEKIRAQITRLEEAMSIFKQKNREMMPELNEMNLGMMSRYESEYQATVLSIQELEANLKVLRLQQEQYRNVSSGGSSGIMGLRRKYADLLIRHTKDHPDAIQMRREIELLENWEASSDAQSSKSVDPEALLDDPIYAKLFTEVEAVERKLGYLHATRRAAKSKLDELEARIAGAPQVEQEYADLQRDLSNLSAKYKDMKDKEIEAQISQNLEEDQKGERFTLLEPAVLPMSPESPNRLLVLAAGFAAAFAIGIGLMGFREILNPGIRSTSTIVKILGATPLLTIPKVVLVENKGSRMKFVLIPAVALSLAVAGYFGYMNYADVIFNL